MTLKHSYIYVELPLTAGVRCKIWHNISGQSQRCRNNLAPQLFFHGNQFLYHKYLLTNNDICKNQFIVFAVLDKMEYSCVHEIFYAQIHLII